MAEFSVSRRTPKHHPLDHAAKEIVRLVPDLIARILCVPVEGRVLRFADTSVRSREHRADHVLLVGELREPGTFGWHLEFQAGDDRREFGRWNQKNAALNEQLKVPIALIIIYLQPGSAPDSFEIVAGGLRNRYQFTAIKLWEYEDRIRSGELSELAPFLILWNHKRGEVALAEQRELILRSSAPAEVIDDLLGWTVVVGSRFFSEEVLRKVFDKELEMLKDWPEVQRWIQEGAERGSLTTARSICKRTLTDQFGPLSPEAEAYLDLRTADELTDLAVSSRKARSLAALGIPA